MLNAGLGRGYDPRTKARKKTEHRVPRKRGKADTMVGAISTRRVLRQKWKTLAIGEAHEDTNLSKSLWACWSATGQGMEPLLIVPGTERRATFTDLYRVYLREHVRSESYV